MTTGRKATACALADYRATRLPCGEGDQTCDPCKAGRDTTRWEGIVEVCKTCDRKAVWPFCEHRDEVRPEGDSWYRLVRVREVGHGR